MVDCERVQRAKLRSVVKANRLDLSYLSQEEVSCRCAGFSLRDTLRRVDIYSSLDP